MDMLLCLKKNFSAQNEDTKAEFNKLTDNLDEIEDRSRRNSLLFSGIPQEHPAENWQQPEDLIKDKFGQS